MARSNLKLQPPAQRDRETTLKQWFTEGSQLHQNGLFEDAETYYKAILKAQPNNLDVKHLLGILRCQQGQYLDSLKLIRQVLAADHHKPIALTNIGNALSKLGRKQEALENYMQALALLPHYAEPLRNSAAILFERGEHREALNYADRAIASQPDVAEAYYIKGTILKAIKHLDEALAAFERASSLDPARADWHNTRGIILKSLGRIDEAIAAYDQVLQLEPDCLPALNNRALALTARGRHDEALRDLDAALNLSPNSADTYNNYGYVLRMMGRVDEEAAYYEKAIALQPDYVEAINNLAVTKLELSGPQDAFDCFARSLAISPDHVETRFACSMVQLLTGDFARGWQGYVHRFQRENSSARRHLDGVPLWQGEDLDGKQIVIFDEQGSGDTLQFIRYLPMVVAKGADVTLLVRPALYRILAAFAERFGAGKIRLITQLDAAGYDLHCSLMDLPALFDTRAETIPFQHPYLFAEPDAVARWAERIGTAGYKVGIAWQGNPNGGVDVGRSVPLRHFAPVARIPDVRLISLQKGYGVEQLTTLPAGMQVETLGDAFDNGSDAFIDTAAAMTHLDLIITSDTSIAHLAGALGRPTWLALKKVPDWRWLLERTDSPWYPTMRLYRQTTRGDWADVFARMAADLATR